MRVPERRFCSYCSAPFLPGDGWPRKCSRTTPTPDHDACGLLTWANPTPVSVLLAVARDLITRQQGLLVVRRNIHPGYGELGLPGGFHNLNETWQQGCCRELEEEADIKVNPNDVELFDVHTVPGNMNLTFGKLRHTLDLDLESVNANLSNAAREETQRVEIMSSPMTLCFESHTLVAAKFFGRPG